MFSSRRKSGTAFKTGFWFSQEIYFGFLCLPHRDRYGLDSELIDGVSVLDSDNNNYLYATKMGFLTATLAMVAVEPLFEIARSAPSRNQGFGNGFNEAQHSAG